MPQFPGTSTDWTLLGPATGHRFSAIYYHSAAEARPGVMMASVNAGDPGLYVGGGTMNAQFATELADPGDYTTVHQTAIADARAAGGGIAITTAFPKLSKPPVLVTLTGLGAGDSGSGSPAPGTTFLDIFTAARPHGVAENMGMAYVVPPYGPSYHDAQGFLGAISDAAGRVVALAARYNAALGQELTDPGLKPLSVIRMCLFSGGQFRRNDTSTDDVAKANFAGLAAALTANSSGLVRVEFESGAGEFKALAGQS